jgi:FixJ family two-component response regulator
VESRLATDLIVHVVDDDANLLRAVARLLRSHEYKVRTYSSAAKFLGADGTSGPGCLLLDLSMPEMTGLELQQVLSGCQSRLGIVFLSGQGDVPAAVQALKAGAVDFITKPFDGEVLVASIDAALRRSCTACEADQVLNRDWELFQTLSPRERQVCLLFSQGLLNKQIAAELGTTERTVKAQRGSVMRKLGAGSAADVVRLIERLRSCGRLK